DSGYFDMHGIDTLALSQNLKGKFDSNEKLVTGYFHPYVYLNLEVIEKNNLNVDDISRTLAHELQNQKGIAFAVPSVDLLEGKVAHTDLNKSILRSYNSKRSGEIFIVLEPYWFINPFDGLEVASTHGS